MEQNVIIMARLRIYIIVAISLCIITGISSCASKSSYPYSITYNKNYTHERASSPTIRPVEPKKETAISNFNVKPKKSKYMGQKATAKKKGSSNSIRHKTLGQQ